MPRVSVILPVKNQSELLLDAIASVFAQKFEDWELIVLDDGSTEDVQGVVRRFKDDRQRVRYIRWEENRGVPHGANHALSIMAGDYFMILAADEWMYPDNLALKVAHLDEHPEHAGVWSLPRNPPPAGERPVAEQYTLKAHNRSREQWLRTLLDLDFVPLGSCTGLFRRAVYEKIGGFRDDLLAFSDHEWFCRFFKHFDGHVIPWRLTVDQGQWANTDSPGHSRSPENAKRAIEELERVRSLHLPITVPCNRKVSAWVPVHNLAPYVRATLDSLWNQTYTDWELHIIDDASTDESAKVIQEWAAKKNDPRIKVTCLKENIGQRRICNMALAAATGDYCMELSADDVIEPIFMQACVEILDMNPTLEFVASQTDFIDAEGKPFEADHPFKNIERASNRSQEEWRATLWRGNVYFGVGVYRTKGLREIGGWNPDNGVISDYALYIELAHRNDIYVIEKNLTHTRIREGNQSAQVKDRQWLASTYTRIKERYYVKRPRVVFATAFYESRGFTPYISAMLQTVKLLHAYGIEWDFMDISGDSYVQRAKNTIMNRFLEMMDATDLFMIDSDMWWNPEAVVNMLMMPEDIVVASYRTKNAWERWTSTPEVVEKDGKRGPIARPLPDGSFLLKGGNLAGGFMRFKRGVLERYKEHFKEHRYQDISADPTNRERVYTEFFACERADGLFWGEDRIFSKRLAAMGQSWWIYPNVNTGHYGIREHMGNFHEYLDKLSKDEAAVAKDEGLTPSANWKDADAATMAIKARQQRAA